MPQPPAAQPVPQHCPTPRELDDLELLLNGALVPLTGFNEPDSPVTLGLPDELATLPDVELVDPEGLPLARATLAADGSRTLTGLARPAYGPFRRLHLSPAQVRERFAGRTFVPVTDALTDVQLDQLRSTGPLVLLALTGAGTPDLSPVALLRATLRVADDLPDAAVVAVPLAAHGDAQADHDLGVQVVGTYAAGDPVLGLLDDGEPLAALADIVEADQPAADEQGLVLFFTGLSGSGKSTLARALMDRLLEAGHRTVTSLDGDVVRRHLSAGLTFSKADRETNILRIGWVAAEVSRHGGVAVCSPIAPFDQTRQQVRAMVDDAGGAFFLVHVATPLAECERRDRKGLYAKARRGEIPEFTGISSPYEEPDDADVRVDTTGRTIEDALDDVLTALAASGYLDLLPRPVVGVRGAPTTSQPEVEVRGAPATSLETPDAAISVLFVCTANICRSPAMELLARRLAGPDTRLVFTSAGTHSSGGRPIDPVVGETLTARGLEIEEFRSTRLTPDLIDAADLVLTAETTHRRFVLEERPTAFRKVFTLGQLVRMLEERDAVGTPPATDVQTLLAELGRRRSNAEPVDDVEDPYGEGPEAAEAATRRIEQLLGRLVPSLADSPIIKP